MKRIKLYESAIIVTIALSAIALAAGEKRPAALGSPEVETASAPAGANDVNLAAKFPYVGEITGTALNIRSGPGMNFYGCGKISLPARVVVVGEQFSWSQILPPPGSFSWIFKQYVQVDANKPEVGIVNADNVRVYAGADDRDAMVSDSVQVMLNKGHKVRLIGQPVGDYYKISPPENSTLWTSSQYIKFIRKADEIDVKLPKPSASAVSTYAKPGVVMQQVDPNSRYLEQYYTLAKQLDDEKAKPLAEQDFSKIRAEFEALASDANSGKAGEYAQYTLKTVARCELAKQSVGVLENQKTEIEQQLAEIEKERQAKRQAAVNENSKFAVIGLLRPSAIYGDQPAVKKRYLVINDQNVPVCYAEAAGEAEKVDMANYLDKKVGLVGEISTDSLSNFALIKFNQIEVLEKEQPREEQAKDEQPKEEQPKEEEKK